MKPTLTRSTIPIRTAAIAEQKYITSTLVLAFNASPANRWLYPDAYQYLTYFPQLIQAFASQSFEYRAVYCSYNYSGAAVWLPPEIQPNTQALIHLIQRSIFEADQPKVLAVLEQLNHCRPQFPHWYLSFIGVEPIYQGKGYGSALMQPVLEECDRNSVPAYLEASNPTHLTFFKRHGFKIMDIIQVGASASIFLMFRQPRGP